MKSLVRDEDTVCRFKLSNSSWMRNKVYIFELKSMNVFCYPLSLAYMSPHIISRKATFVWLAQIKIAPVPHNTTCATANRVQQNEQALMIPRRSL